MDYALCEQGCSSTCPKEQLMHIVTCAGESSSPIIGYNQHLSEGQSCMKTPSIRDVSFLGNAEEQKASTREIIMMLYNMLKSSVNYYSQSKVKFQAQTPHSEPPFLTSTTNN